MTREETMKRFNDLPKEHRTTIIAVECEHEIRWIEHEKREMIKSHKKNLDIINERIRSAEKCLRTLGEQET